MFLTHCGILDQMPCNGHWGSYYRREIVPVGEGWDRCGLAQVLGTLVDMLFSPCCLSHHLVHRNWASMGLTLGQHWPLGFHKTREALVTAENFKRPGQGPVVFPTHTKNVTRQLGVPEIHPELDHRTTCWCGKPGCCQGPTGS